MHIALLLYYKKVNIHLSPVMHLLPFLLAFSAGLFGGNAPDEPEWVMPEEEPSITAPARARADALAINMFRDVVAENAGNIVFSPASAESLLRLLQQAAQGQTRAELDALPMGEQGVETAISPRQAAALYADKTLHLKPAKTPVQRVDFQHKPADAVKQVNAWCSKQTEGRINTILTEQNITPQTRLVALNALYLKERWLRPFKEHNTENALFHKADGSVIHVPMMSQTEHLRTASGQDWVAVALLYSTAGREGTPGAFIGILPKGDARAFAAKLTPQKYADIVHALAQCKPKETMLYLPKFRLTTDTISLQKVLTHAGVRTMFTDAAQFSFAEEPLKVADVLQRCFVEMTEDGTEAAAITAVVMKDAYIVPEPPPVIRFDKPFLWAIGDLTSGAAPWFMGLTEEP